MILILLSIKSVIQLYDDIRDLTGREYG